MKKIEYICNMCGDSYIKPEAFNKIKAYYHITTATGKTFDLRDINADCDRHICNDCIDVITKHKNQPK